MEVNRCMNCMQEHKTPGPCPNCGFNMDSYAAGLHHLQPGSRLNDRYLIGRVFEEDKYGITYVSWDAELELKVAIREYFPNGFVVREADRNPAVVVLRGYRAEFFNQGMEKFMEEAKGLAKFWQMPGVLSVRDCFRSNGTVYRVQEFIEGESLQIYMEKNGGSMTPGEILGKMKPVMETLALIHEAGIIHRNICPENIQIDSLGQFKLTGFESGRNVVVVAVAVQSDGVPKAPEGLSKQGIRSDIYSLCATIYWAITGEKLSMAEAPMKDTIKWPSQLGKAMERQQEEALMKGLKDIQDGGFASVKELRDGLFNLTGGKTSEFTENTGTDSQERVTGNKTSESQQPGVLADEKITRHKPKGFAVAAAIVVVLALFISVWKFMGTGNESGDDAALTGQEAAVRWKDANMERLIRKGLDRPAGDVSSTELAEIKILRITGNKVYLSRDVGEDSGNKATEDISKEELIVSLEDLKWLPNLQKLEISRHNIQNLEPLVSLQALEELNLENSSIRDVSVLGNMAQLTKLNLNDNHIIDISPLSGLTELGELHLRGCGISNLTPLSGMVQLTVLNLNDNNINDISVLSSMTALTTLYLRGSNINDVTPLSGVKNLEVLNLRENKLSDIQPLAELVNLKQLYLNHNEIKDISPLSELTNMQILVLNRNIIRDIHPLAKLTELVELHLDDNKIDDAGALSQLSKLSILNLSNNHVKGVKKLSALRNLKELYLAGNPVEDVDSLSEIIAHLEGYSKP